jgi:hypothetical protein
MIVIEEKGLYLLSEEQKYQARQVKLPGIVSKPLLFPLYL